jgi:hypothetical protein
MGAVLIWTVFSSVARALFSNSLVVSSGGALVDAKGSLVGITTFLLKDAQNLNFAIAAEEYWR